MAKTAKELREERQNLFVAELKPLADQSADEKRAWAADDENKWQEVNKRYDDLTAEIEGVEKAENERASALAAREARFAEVQKQQDQRSQNRPQERNVDYREQQQRENGQENQHALAFQGWARNQYGLEIEDRHVAAARAVGVSLHSGEFRFDRSAGLSRGAELRAQSVATDTAGGYLQQGDFIMSLEKALKQFGSVMNVAQVMRTPNSNTLRWPTVDDTSNTGSAKAENEEVTETAVAFGKVEFGAYKYTSDAILVSHELMRESVVNMEQVIGELAGERLGRKANNKLTVGTGAGEPQGIVTGAVSGKTAASATALTLDEILDLVGSVDPAYANSPSAGFMMHRNIAIAIRKLKDGSGAYHWTPSVVVGQPDMLWGYPVNINQDMASSIATGGKSILFGQLDKYKVREVGAVRLRRLDERYAEKDQVGFIAFAEWDGGHVNAGQNPIKYLVQA